jgi:hypothetical protein
VVALNLSEIAACPVGRQFPFLLRWLSPWSEPMTFQLDPEWEDIVRDYERERDADPVKDRHKVVLDTKKRELSGFVEFLSFLAFTPIIVWFWMLLIGAILAILSMFR